MIWPPDLAARLLLAVLSLLCVLVLLLAVCEAALVLYDGEDDDDE